MGCLEIDCVIEDMISRTLTGLLDPGGKMFYKDVIRLWLFPFAKG